MDRRRFLLTSASAGALVPLTACGPTVPVAEGPIGGFANPHTSENPGNFADLIPPHLPTVYAGFVNETDVRLWVEIGSPEYGVHEQAAAHYIQQIVIQDDFLNNIASSGMFPFNAEARLVANATIEPPVNGIYAYGLCNLHGWWRSYFPLDLILRDPLGDARRAYTVLKPNPDAVPGEHIPILGTRPDGQMSVEIGDRSAGQLHPQQQAHHITQVLIFDENDQLRGNYGLAANGGEPVINFAPIAAQRLRVLAFCNLHMWWEAEYQVSPAI